MKKVLYFKTFVFLIIILLFGSVSYTEASSVKHQYFKAEAEYRNIKNSTKKKYRSNWSACISMFEKAHKTDPLDPWAPAAMYHEGFLYLEMAEVSFLKKDIKEGLDIMEKLIKKYPGSRYKYKALKQIRENKDKLLSSSYKSDKKDPIKSLIIKSKEPAVKKPDLPTNSQFVASKKPKITETELELPSTDLSTNTQINEIRFHTHNNRTRIVVDSESEIKYNFNDLNKDGENKKPPRVYIDFKNALLAQNINKTYQVFDPQVEKIRIGQYDKETVRIVVDLKSKAKDFKVFSLFKPYRTVIDVWGETSNGDKNIKAHPVVSRQLENTTAKKADSASLIKQLALGVNRIVIDPGHGGKDYGAPGYYKGSHEKYTVMDISKKLASKIKKELGYEVILTRDDDTYLTLEQRTEIANTNRADLFISIHTNAARNKDAYGIETYFLNLATDEDSISVAARENATSTKNISDLQTILNDLMRDAKINESSRLATHIQNSMVSSLKSGYSNIKDRGVKQAPFYVLLGARMPAVLLEVSFISNPRECKRLSTDEYQDKICDGILNGIKKYIKETDARAVYYEPDDPEQKG
ncbi:MAG: N-acetylmuramoyl-L-alanine amidase [Desulforegulaceae bacterium]|nr:N-acetylmuramoyl-L-alanine amidase [Desulforegulaceae bacterium]